MAITKINTPELLDINTTGAKQLPSGPTTGTGGRPTTGLTAGDFRYNTDDDRVEYYDGTSPYDAAKWFQIDDEALPVGCTTDTINYPTGTTNTAYYKMSDATDSTLNGYNGTATDVDFNVQGKFGNAGEFNGSSSKIEAINSALSSNTIRSYSVWFKKSSSSEKMILANNNGSTYGAHIAVSAGNQLNGWVYNEEQNNYYFNLFGGSVTFNVWHHAVLTWGVNASDCELYLNGASVATASSVNGNVPTTTAPNNFKIGDYTGNLFWNGSIDQVRIFSTVLTLGNVTSLYNEVQCVPAIIPSDYFNPLLYTGNNNTQSIDDLTFAPDLVWIKSRSNGTSHELNDSVRGQVSRLFSDSTSAQGTVANGFVSLDSNGFSLNNAGNGGEVNGLNRTYVAWNWKSGGAPTATNSAGAGNVPTAGSVKIDGADSTTALAGTIAATRISANTDAGFSIVEWSSSGVLATVGHGLDSAPELIIGKGINWSSSWPVYALPVGNNKKMSLNDSIEAHTSTIWGNTTPTTTTFNQDFTGTTNRTSIAYCFHSVDGYSDIGSYIGTNAPNNTIVTGFRPAYLMIKLTSAANGNWIIFDNKRNTSNPLTDVLKADDAGAETTEAALNIDFLSNGFTLNGAAGAGGTGQINSIGETYIYLAIAEQVYNANAVTANQTNPFNDGSQIAQYEFEDNADDSQPNGYIGKGGTFKTSQGNIILPVGVYNNAAAGASISFWMKSGGTSYETPIYTRTGSAAAGWAIRTSTGGNGINWSWQNASGNVVFASGEESVTLTDGWHHVVAIWDGTTSTNGAKLYIDGSLFDELTANATLASQTFTLGPTLGADRQSSGRSILGLDQVRIYNTALNPNDVWLLYSETSATSSTLDYPASTGAIALYELEGDATNTGSSTYDGAATAVAWVPLYDGTDGGTVTYAAPSVSAPFLKAGEFNGSSSKVTVGNSIKSVFTNNFTASVWCKPSSVATAAQTIFDFFEGAGVACKLQINSSNLKFQSYNGSSYDDLTASETLLNQVWYYFVLTRSGNNYELFINGISAGVLTSNTAEETSNPFGIGYSTANSQYFNGSIDQVRIFNRVLDSGEVLQLYNEPNN